MDKTRWIILLSLALFLLPKLAFAIIYEPEEGCRFDLQITTPTDNFTYYVASSEDPKWRKIYYRFKIIENYGCSDTQSLVFLVHRRVGNTTQFEDVAPFKELDLKSFDKNVWIERSFTFPADPSVSPQDYYVSYGWGSSTGSIYYINQKFGEIWFKVAIVDTLPPLTCNDVRWSLPEDGDSIKYSDAKLTIYVTRPLNSDDSVSFDLYRGSTYITSIDPTGGSHSEDIYNVDLTQYYNPNDNATVVLKVNGNQCETRSFSLYQPFNYSYAWYSPESGGTYGTDVPYKLYVSYSEGVGKICLKRCISSSCAVLGSWSVGSSGWFDTNITHDPGTYTAYLYIDTTGSCNSVYQEIERRTYTVESTPPPQPEVNCDYATVNWTLPEDGGTYPPDSVPLHAEISNLVPGYEVVFTGYKVGDPDTKIAEQTIDLNGVLDKNLGLVVEAQWNIYYYIRSETNQDQHSGICEIRQFETKNQQQTDNIPDPTCATANFSIIIPEEGGTYDVNNLQIVMDVAPGDLHYNGEKAYHYLIYLQRYTGIWTGVWVTFVHNEGRTVIDVPNEYDGTPGHYRIWVKKAKDNGNGASDWCIEVEFDLTDRYDINYIWIEPYNNYTYHYPEGSTPQVPFRASIQYHIPTGHICWRLGNYSNGWNWNVLKDYTGDGSDDINEILSQITTAGFYRMQLYYSSTDCSVKEELIEERQFTVAEDRNVEQNVEVNGWVSGETWATEETITLPPSQRQFSTVQLDLYDFLPEFLYYIIGLIMTIQIAPTIPIATATFSVWLVVGLWAGLFHYSGIVITFIITSLLYIVARILGVIS